eukprot:833477-Amphidinium_carterae.1
MQTSISTLLPASAVGGSTSRNALSTLSTEGCGQIRPPGYDCQWRYAVAGTLAATASGALSARRRNVASQRAAIQNGAAEGVAVKFPLHSLGHVGRRGVVLSPFLAFSPATGADSDLPKLPLQGYRA